MLLLSSSMSVFVGSILIHDPATIKASSFNQMRQERSPPIVPGSQTGVRGQQTRTFCSVIGMFICVTSAEAVAALFQAAGNLYFRLCFPQTNNRTRAFSRAGAPAGDAAELTEVPHALIRDRFETVPHARTHSVKPGVNTHTPLTLPVLETQNVPHAGALSLPPGGQISCPLPP